MIDNVVHITRQSRCDTYRWSMYTYFPHHTCYRTSAHDRIKFGMIRVRPIARFINDSRAYSMHPFNSHVPWLATNILYRHGYTFERICSVAPSVNRTCRDVMATTIEDCVTKKITLMDRKPVYLASSAWMVVDGNCFFKVSKREHPIIKLLAFENDWRCLPRTDIIERLTILVSNSAQQPQLEEGVEDLGIDAPMPKKHRTQGVFDVVAVSPPDVGDVQYAHFVTPLGGEPVQMYALRGTLKDSLWIELTAPNIEYLQHVVRYQVSNETLKRQSTRDVGISLNPSSLSDGETLERDPDQPVTPPKQHDCHIANECNQLVTQRKYEPDQPVLHRKNLLSYFSKC